MNGRLESLTGLWLLDPEMLLLALLVPLCLAVRRRRGRPAARFGPAGFLAGLPRSWRVRLLPLKPALQAAGLMLVALALARPVVRIPQPLAHEGIDILLCLDTSSSMAGRDLDPRRTRLDVAKDAAARFLAGRPHDRIGLLVFARYPDVLCPLTLDHEALLAILDQVEPTEREGPEDMTGIGTAVARAARLLQGTGGKSRVVILLTDGEENVATAQTPDEIGPLRAGRLCETLGVRVYAIAAGGGPQAPGAERTAVDTGQIERLAELSGGRFFQARDAAAVAGVYAAIDGLEKVEREERRYDYEERFLWFLLPALGLLLLGGALEAAFLEVVP